MIRRPPRSTRTYTLFPYTSLFRSIGRPSTYAAILEVLRARNYVTMDSKRFLPEDAGWLAYAFLVRSEEHTSELQSLMRSSYAVFCLKKKKKIAQRINTTHSAHRQKT